MLEGRINSFQSLGTVDGPGVRTVVFFQGCTLRCCCCHNPETWEFSGGEKYTVKELFDKIMRFKAYFGKDGGVTFSGGEVLYQSDFAYEVFRLLRNEGVHTCIDTSGCILNDSVKKLLDVTQLVLLDIKYTDKDEHLKYTGSELSHVYEFLRYCQSKDKPVWIRQVVIPGINDSEKQIRQLFLHKKKYPCIKKLELLPFRKLCCEKYKELGIEFPFADVPEADTEKIKELSDRMNAEF